MPGTPHAGEAPSFDAPKEGKSACRRKARAAMIWAERLSIYLSVIEELRGPVLVFWGQCLVFLKFVASNSLI